jgi:hypothetical protein
MPKSQISIDWFLIPDSEPAFLAENQYGSSQKSPESESGSTDLIESGSNPDPDPKHLLAEYD